MKKWAFIIDVEKCEDCNNCFLACKDEHVGNEWKGYTQSQPLHGHRWINIFRKERGQYPLIDVAYLPVPCMHCDNAPCIKAAKDNAITKREDGIIMIDPEKAVGEKELIKACPYDAIWWNDEKNVPQKCTFCAHLIDDGWEKPRCVQACPTGALKAIKVDDKEMASLIKTESLEILKPELNSRPRVYYKNLFLYEKCFISGSVAFDNDGNIDCAEGAEVSLLKDSKKIAEMKTDNFGDFKFDGLDENSGAYSLEIIFKGHMNKSLDVELDSSLSLGSILMDKS